MIYNIEGFFESAEKQPKVVLDTRTGSYIYGIDIIEHNSEKGQLKFDLIFGTYFIYSVKTTYDESREGSNKWS